MLNNRTAQNVPSIFSFLHPIPQYVPLADVGFGPLQIVLPHELPPSSYIFPNAMANKMNNLPSVEQIWDYDRTKRIL